ncbi:hypothetical protein [Vacuolonema iberomarrocanum]|uniref:hypothetical protein n=1 Tax=Vacuolonema iberomarrocanum TaxID=3454632 RepID=UPI003F6E43C2
MHYSAFVRGLMLAGSLVFFLGCQETTPPVAGDTPSPDESVVAPPTEEESPSPETPEAPTETSATEISATAFGIAELGMTLGDLKAALPDATFEVQSPFIVDFDAIAVSQDGEVQFYILYLAGDTFDDTGVIQGMLTESPTYQTAEGIGPGSSIADAEAVYGNAIVAYNTENESREYVRFEQHPANNLAFGTGSGPEAGIYPDVDAPYRETEEYRPDATIQSAMIICLTDDCTAPE